MIALPCPKCKHGKEVKTGDAGNPYQTTYNTYCHACYDADCVGDPPEFISRDIVGYGRTEEASVEEWNFLVEELMADTTDPLPKGGE